MKVKLNDVQLAFPGLFEARAMAAGDDPAFSATFLFAKDHPAHGEMTKAMQAVADEKWGPKAPAILKAILAKGDVCMKDGIEKAHYSGFEGNYFVSARSKTRPTVVDQNKTPLTAADGKIYGGCYVNAIVDVWAMDNQYGKRICATLSGVQFRRDGEAFGGGRPASADDFDVVEEDMLA